MTFFPIKSNIENLITALIYCAFFSPRGLSNSNLYQREEMLLWAHRDTMINCLFRNTEDARPTFTRSPWLSYTLDWGVNYLSSLSLSLTWSPFNPLTERSSTSRNQGVKSNLPPGLYSLSGSPPATAACRDSLTCLRCFDSFVTRERLEVC